MKTIQKIVTVLLFYGLANVGYAASLVASDARVRLVPPVSTGSAAYVTLRNNAPDPVTIVGVSSPVCRKAMMHRADMKAMKRVTVAAHGVVHFAVGGDHIMLMGLNHALRIGERVPLLLHLKGGDTMPIDAVVVDMR